MSNAKIYHDLIDQIFAEKIAIRLWPASDPFKYCPNGIYGNCTGQPVILVPRAKNGTWLNPGATATAVSEYICNASDPDLEMICVAHEFGHHFSTFSNYEQVRKAFDADPQSASLGDRQQLYDEEVFAWDKARANLTSLGLSDWTLFDKLESESLGGYRKGYRV